MVLIILTIRIKNNIMNLKKCCLVAILVITSNFVMYAQNARFSQIGTIATQLNPS